MSGDETWLLAHRAISVSPNRVLPTFRPEKLS